MTETETGVYVRVSQDRDEDETSTERQESSCRAFAAAREWAVADVYRDAGISAYDRRAVRPELERLRRDLQAGRLAVVLVWRSDRLFRNLRGFVDFLDELEGRGVAYASVTEGFDTSTPAGRFALQMLGAFAEYESASTSQRLLSRNRADATAGRAHAGGRRAFGYDRNGSIVPEEAALLREGAERFLRGESLRSVVTEWNRRTPPVLTTAGNAWQSSTLSQALRSPRLAGLRVHHDELHPGTWEAIIPPEEWYRLQDAMQPNRSRRFAQRRSEARHLLTGLLTCSLCRAPMRSSGGDARRYKCRRDDGGCGRVSITAEPTEDAVRDTFLAAVGDEALRRKAEHHGARDTLAAAERDLLHAREGLHELGTLYFQDRVITRDEFTFQRGPLAERVRLAEERVSRLRLAPEPASLPSTAAALRRWWETAAVPDRRAALEVYLAAVIVSPVRQPGYARFDLKRLNPVWRA